MRALIRLRDAILKRWRGRRLFSLKEWARFAIPWVLVVVGLVVMALSIGAEIRPLESVPFDGDLAPATTRNVTFARSGFEYAEVRLNGTPSCSLRVWVLTSAGAAQYEATGFLPDFPQIYWCQRTRGFHQGDIALLVLRNPSNGTIPYSFQIDLFIVFHPQSGLILPGLLLFFAGAIPAISDMLRTGLTRLVDDLAAREEYDPSRQARSPSAGRAGEASPDEGLAKDEDHV